MLSISGKSSTALIPYLTILVGLHILKSAWAAIILYHGAIFFIVLKNSNPVLFKRLFRGWNWKIGFPLTAISALAGLSLYFLWPIMRIEGTELSAILNEYGLHGSSWIVFMIYYCVSTPVLEEIFWRGYLSVPNRRPSAPDILFAGYHIIVLILFLKPLPIAAVFLTLVVAAWIWRLISLKFNGLAMPSVSHLVAGISVIWFVNLILKQ
ncbi:MAG: CPBP family intramembrane metalloprotease [Candidatus Zixiibacteriota bacterium]|nr:MAG: CPBP family intramembrane metalloprotease [candidate division Zixibacteria bacterium]